MKPMRIAAPGKDPTDRLGRRCGDPEGPLVGDTGESQLSCVRHEDHAKTVGQEAHRAFTIDDKNVRYWWTW